MDKPVGCQFVQHDLDDYQRNLKGCPPPTDEASASKLPNETQNISPGQIPEKTNQNMAIGNSIDCDNSVKYLPDVLNMAKRNFERFFDMRPGASTQEQIDRSSFTVTGWAAVDVRENQGVFIVKHRKGSLEEDVGRSERRMSTVRPSRMRRTPS